jgi:hypothetical protein
MERSAMHRRIERMQDEAPDMTPGAPARRVAGRAHPLAALLVAVGALVLATTAPEASAKKQKKEVQLSVAKIYWEYNSTPSDLGVHVSLDGEDWKELAIVNPDGTTIFKVEGKGPYRDLGMTELFFEGAEPALSEFPLADLLDLFPEGVYEFEGKTVDGDEIEGEAVFTHAIPAGPVVSADVGPGDSLVIHWEDVTGPPAGFPNLAIEIVGYQVLVGSFQVTLPATANSVTVSPEFVDSLASGVHPFEVLAIEAGGNQTITEGTFTIP